MDDQANAVMAHLLFELTFYDIKSISSPGLQNAVQYLIRLIALFEPPNPLFTFKKFIPPVILRIHPFHKLIMQSIRTANGTGITCGSAAEQCAASHWPRSTEHVVGHSSSERTAGAKPANKRTSNHFLQTESMKAEA